MRPFMLGSTIALAVLMAAGHTSSVQAEGTDVVVRFEVELPANTPGGPIYIAGNLPQVGGWNAAGLALTRVGLSATGTIRIARTDSLEFKITRGSWATVEKTAQFADITNRRYVPADDRTAEGGTHVVKIKVDAWGDSAPPIPHTLTGDIRRHENFHSRILRNNRTVLVYLPPGYNSARTRYPVLYMHDGQNVFDAATSFIGVEWGVDEACEQLITAGQMRPVIVVAIANNDSRVEEYTPTRASYRNEGGRGGRGRAYTRFLLEEVKPFIDTTYRTLKGRPSTTVMGSSLGGLISLDMAWQHPDVFGAAGVVSPALWWDNHEIIRRVERGPAPHLKPRLWIDMGTKEGDSLESFRDSIGEMSRLGTALERIGFRRDRDFTTYEAEGADHSERAWNARIAMILKWLYPPVLAQVGRTCCD